MELIYARFIWTLKPEILENHVGKYENHTVITDDGYILLIFRIPKENPKGVIFLAHPLSVDSFVWVGQGNTSVGKDKEIVKLVENLGKIV